MEETSSSNGCRLVNPIVKVTFGLLSLNAIVMWLWSSSITPEHNWVCLQCRASRNPSMGQQFLFYSVWSFWLTFLVFVTWILLGRQGTDSAYSRRIRTLHQIAFQLALPHVTTVIVTYVYYVATNPIESFLDMDACYHLGRANLGKTFTDSPAIINLYLVLMNVQDWTVHYLSAPFLLFLWGTRQSMFLGRGRWTFPWSTMFVVVLSTTMAIAQLYCGVVLYCGGMWFTLCLFTATNLVFHSVYVATTRYYSASRRQSSIERKDENLEGAMTREETEVNVREIDHKV